MLGNAEHVDPEKNTFLIRGVSNNYLSWGFRE